MNTYNFDTITTMKEYNRDKWWIDERIVPDMIIKAKTLTEALHIWRDKVQYDCSVEISNNALKCKNAMYIDNKDGEPEQCGYVITGKTSFMDDYKDTMQYIDLWVTIQQVLNPFA